MKQLLIKFFEYASRAYELTRTTNYRSPILLIGLHDGLTSGHNIGVRAIPAIGVFRHHRSVAFTLFSVLWYEVITLRNVNFDGSRDDFLDGSLIVIFVSFLGFLFSWLAPSAPKLVSTLLLIFHAIIFRKFKVSVLREVEIGKFGAMLIILTCYILSYSAVIFLAKEKNLQINYWALFFVAGCIFVAFIGPILVTISSSALKIDKLENLGDAIYKRETQIDRSVYKNETKGRAARINDVYPSLHWNKVLEKDVKLSHLFHLPLYKYVLMQMVAPNSMGQPIISPVQNMDRIQSAIGKLFFMRIVREYRANAGVLLVTFPLMGGWIVLLMLMLSGLISSKSLIFGSVVLLLLAIANLAELNKKFVEYVTLSSNERTSLPAWLCPHSNRRDSRVQHIQSNRANNVQIRQFLTSIFSLIFGTILVTYLTMLSVVEFRDDKIALFKLNGPAGLDASCCCEMKFSCNSSALGRNIEVGK